MGKLDNDKNLEEIADSYLVQKDQRQRTEQVLTQASLELYNIEKLNVSNDNALDQLLKQVEELSAAMGYSQEDITEYDYKRGNEMLELNSEEQSQITVPCFDVLVNTDVSSSWDEYMNQIYIYATGQNLDLTKNPFDLLLTEAEKNEIGQRIHDDYIMQKAHCDKYDYIIAAFCGVVCGLIDSFFVGMPEKSKLGAWTDDQADKFVSKISKGLWKKDARERDEILNMFKSNKITKEQRDKMLKDAGIPYNKNLKEQPQTLQQCIQYLEKKFGVNYDASSAAFVEGNGALAGMRPLNHHIMSLAHSPSIIGLLFSIVDQFTGEASFVDKGKLIRLRPKEKKNEIDRFELRGTTFATKLLCGFTNCLGHLCSDLVGSNTTRATSEGGRGSGIPVPFMELLQFCTFNVPDKNGEKMAISELTVKIFERGYDLRFATTTAIPVLLNELMIRLMWSLKSRFYNKNSWKDSVPFGNHPELRRMLLAGHGTLCAIDVVDAGIRSVDLITFTLHLNVAAWTRLGISGIQEIRLLYKENVIDIDVLDHDLEIEWQRMYRQVF